MIFLQNFEKISIYMEDFAKKIYGFMVNTE